MLKSLTVSLVVLTLLAGSASAALLGADNFETYAAGSNLTGQNGGEGFGGAWTLMAGKDANSSPLVVAGGLSYTGGNVVADGGSQAIKIAQEGGKVAGSTTAVPAWRALPATIAPTAGQNVYVSFLIKTTGMQDLLAPRDTDRYAYIALDNDESSSAQMAVGMRWAAATDNEYWYDKAGTTATNMTTGENVYVEGQTYLMVMKATSNGSVWSEVKLFTNPTSTTTEAGTYEVTSASTWNVTIDQLNLRQFNIGPWGSTEMDRLWYDNVRVGTTWGDVVVPEPTSMVLLGLGGIAALARKRR